MPLHGTAMLVDFAKSVCDDVDLAEALTEILEVTGEPGHVDIQGGQGRTLRPANFEGNFCNSGSHGTGGAAVELEDAALLPSDFDFKDAEEVLPILRLALRENIENLVVVARQVAEPVAALFGRSESSSCLLISGKAPSTRSALSARG